MGMFLKKVTGTRAGVSAIGARSLSFAAGDSDCSSDMYLFSLSASLQQRLSPAASGWPQKEGRTFCEMTISTAASDPPGRAGGSGCDAPSELDLRPAGRFPHSGAGTISSRYSVSKACRVVPLPRLLA